MMRGFVEHTLPHVQAHLILAGSTVHAITDDPEEPATLDEVQAAWRALGHEQRARVSVACLPMHDVEENAAIVNALQRPRRRDRQEEPGGGLRAWRDRSAVERRAVVASDVGGHRDQIRHQHSGLLVDPADACSFGSAIAELLANPALASAYGDAGHDIVKQLYLDSRQLAEWDELLAALAETTSAKRSASNPKLEIVHNRMQSTKHDAGPVATSSAAVTGYLSRASGGGSLTTSQYKPS